MYRIFGLQKNGRSLCKQALAGAILVLAGASHLPATTLVRAIANAYDSNISNPQNTGFLAALSASAASGPYTDFGGTFEAKSYVVFNPLLGPRLGTYSSTVNTYPLFQSFTIGEATWISDFTVIGTPGTQVTFNLGIHLNDALFATEFAGYQSNLGSEGVAQLTGLDAAGGLSIYDLVTNLSSSLALNRSAWKTVTYNVGDVVTVGVDLYTDADAQGGAAIADAFSTGLFALQVVTPGGGYTTENGVVFLDSFVETVPEPSTMVLGCLSLLVVAAGKRRSLFSRR